MKRYIQHDFLKISHFVTREWRHPVHNHNHFEIIFIHRGKGLHSLSGMNHPYTDKSLFLLAPSDFHHFDIHEETEFTFLKFTNVYWNGVGNIPVPNRWNQAVDELLIQAGRQTLPLLKSAAEADKADGLLRLIVAEWAESKNETNETIFFLMQALLSMVKRNTQTLATVAGQKHTEKLTSIIHYLHTHIYSIERTQLENLAEVFGYSKHYLGIFFKEQVGTTLRDYVNQYKLHLIENRLKYSSFSIKEISHELDFTDLSHFNKFFKSHRRMNPTEFRKLQGVVYS